MRKRKAGQPAGTDLDWFVIPIQRIRQWGLILGLLVVAGIVGYFALHPGPPLAAGAGPRRDRRGRIGALPRDPRGRRRAAGLQRRPGARLPPRRPRVLHRFALRGGVPARRRIAVVLAPGPRRLGPGRAGRCVLHLRRRGRLAPARRPLDLRARAAARSPSSTATSSRPAGPARPRSCSSTARCTRSVPARSSSAAARSPRNRRAARSRSSPARSTSTRRTRSSTVATDAATRRSIAIRACRSTSAPGDKTEVTNFRGRTTVSTGKETVVLEGRESIAAAAATRQFSAKETLPDSPQPILPADNRIYDLKTGDQVDLKWTKVAEATRYRLQISRSQALRPGRHRGRPRRPRADPARASRCRRRVRTSGAWRPSTRRA